MDVASPTEGPRPSRERPGAAKLYEVARDEELRRLQAQESQLENIRNRVGTFLAFTGAATAFLIGTALSGARRDSVFVAIAISTGACSVLMLISAIGIFLGGYTLHRPAVQRWTFTLEARTLLNAVDPDIHPPSESQFNAYVAGEYADLANYNEPLMVNIQRQFVVFIVAACVQTAGWAALLCARG